MGIQSLGMIGLGRMGSNMVRRLARDGVRCVVHDSQPAAVEALTGPGITAAHSLEEMVRALPAPRAIWVRTARLHC